MYRSNSILLNAWLVQSLLLGMIEAWSPLQQSNGLSRRNLLRDTAAASVLAWSSQVQQAVAASTTDSLLEELQTSQSKLKEIPGLLQEQEWDKVRTILKTPPVNKLWNLGDSQNIVLQLAKDTGNVEWFEVKEDLAYNLQMCDQLTYNNVFVYFQPGNGKIKIKEPQEAAERAISQIQQLLDESK
jgi:hypothetical protein